MLQRMVSQQEQYTRVFYQLSFQIMLPNTTRMRRCQTVGWVPWPSTESKGVSDFFICSKVIKSNTHDLVRKSKLKNVTQINQDYRIKPPYCYQNLDI